MMFPHHALRAFTLVMKQSRVHSIEKNISLLVAKKVLTAEQLAEMQLPTPPDSARSFYSATAPSATTSGHHTARTMFFTPESSPQSAVTVSSQPSPELRHDECPTQVFPIPDQVLYMNMDGERLCQSSALDDYVSKNALSARSSHLSQDFEMRANGLICGESVTDTDIGCSDGMTALKVSVKGEVSRVVPVFRADDMSEAYEMIPGLDSPTSSNFCFAVKERGPNTVEEHVSHFSRLDDSSRVAIDDFAAVIEAPSFHNYGRCSMAVPGTVSPSSAPLNELQTLAAMEPPVSMAPAISISWPAGLFTFSSADEAKESIARFSMVLLQLQNMHGECNLDALLTCTRLASAHHFIKDLVEAKSLYTKCLQMSARYALTNVIIWKHCCNLFSVCVDRNIWRRVELLCCCMILNRNCKDSNMTQN